MSRPRDQGADQLSLDSGMALLLWPGPAPPATHTHTDRHTRTHTHTCTHIRARACTPGAWWNWPQGKSLTWAPARAVCSLSCCSEAFPDRVQSHRRAHMHHVLQRSLWLQVWAGMRAVGIGEESCSDSSQFMARPFPCGEQSLFECDGGLGS